MPRAGNEAHNGKLTLQIKEIGYMDIRCFDPLHHVQALESRLPG
ncbi:MAG: hypothetical protein ACRYGK_03725 [Janthinobacterium lividum]